jgi:hypothetical protein
VAKKQQKPTEPKPLPLELTDEQEAELLEYLVFNVSWADRNKSQVPQVVRDLALALSISQGVEE